MANVFSVPEFIITGEGALGKSMVYMKEFGKKALIVTDDMMVSLGNVNKLTAQLDDAEISYAVYSGVDAEPDHIMVEEGAALYIEKNCDFLIGIGGGSPIDTAKAIGVVVSSGGKISDYMHKRIPADLPPVAAIPTTAGTGTEATKVSIITDTEKGIKMLLSDPKLMADLAVVDPVFTMTVPQSVTANTGVDALCHAIESYTSRKAFPLSRMFSADAVKKIYRSLPKAYMDGSDIEARREMAEASLEAGIAFSNASVSIIHGMSRPIGAMFHVPHGLSNAMLLKVCLPYIREGAEEDIFFLAKETGIYKGNDIAEGADVFTDAVNELLHQLSVPGPDEVGIDREEFVKKIPKMAEDALSSGSPQNCLNIPDKNTIETLYLSLLKQYPDVSKKL